MDTATKLLGGRAQGIEITEAVNFGEKAGLAIVPPLYDMLGYTRQMKSRFPWHRRP
jgi:hypothetical protein